MNTLAHQIAQILFAAGIRLESERETDALSFYLGGPVVTKIEDAVIASNAVLDVHATDIQSRGFERACRLTAMDHADGLSQQIDAELWAMQQEARIAA